MDDLSGSVIGGRYRLDRTLGQGGMGVVYAATQLDLQRRVAVKLMLATTGEALQRFALEARSAASLGNPHIVQVFDFQPPGADPAFMVMELLNGPSLRDLVKREGAMESRRLARIGLQVASALDAAHRAGIVHRDLKPGNIVVTYEPTLGEVAKVLDFGIAKLTNPNAPPITRDGDMVGTLAYMSPEQAGGGAVDARSDLYSLGATLFFALTTQRPVEGRSPEELLFGIIEGRTRPLASVLPSIDPALGVIVDRSLALDPRARFASAEEMAHALAAWLESGNTSLPPPVPTFAPPMPALAPQNPQKGSGIGWVLLAVVALVGVFLVIAVGIGWMYLEASPGETVASAAAPAVSAPAPIASAAPVTTAGVPSPVTAPVAVPGVPKPAANPTALDAGATPSPAASTSSSSTKTPGACIVAADCGKGAWSCKSNVCSCPPPGTMCGSVCTNLFLDGSNCGQCGKACASGDFCSAQGCQSCAPPQNAECGGRCVNVFTDLGNCGACGKKCLPGKLCIKGACAK